MATSGFIATTGEDAIRAYWWIEIEGIRHRFGSRDPAWNPVVGPNQHIYPYIEKMPAISPQVAEPLNGTTTPYRFTVDIVDVDEVFTDLMSVFIQAGYSTLDEDLTENETSIDVVDSTGFTIGDDFFVGRETMLITNIVGNTLTVSRGRYGSRRAEHVDGDPCYNKQPFMLTREIVLHENRRAGMPYLEADEGLPETDAIKMRGFLEDAEENNGVWTLHCAGFLRRLNVRIGENLAHSTLKKDLWGGEINAGILGQEAGLGVAGFNVAVSNVVLIGDSTDFQAAGHVLVDEELIRYIEIATPPPGETFDGLCLSDDAADFTDHFHFTDTGNRGLLADEIFGSDGRIPLHENLPGSANIQKSILMSPHKVGAEVKEVIHSDSFTEGTGPAEVILTLLTSTGDADNGDYDVLPKGWGCGIDEDYIDVTGIENACKEPPLDGFDFAPFVIPEAVDCKDWIEENILRPCLLFFVEDEMGLITVKRMYDRNSAIELTTPTALDNDDLVGLPSIRIGYPFGEFQVKMNWNPGTDDFLGTVICKLDKGNEYYLGAARKFELECKTLYDPRIGRGRGSWTSGDTGDLPGFLAHYLGVIWDNYALKPIPILRFSVGMNMLYYVQVGQVITLTCSGLVDLRNGDRGVVTEYFQIVEAGPNPERSSVDCVAWMIGGNNSNTRLLAPAAKVKSWDAVNHRATLYDDTFTDGIKFQYDIDAFAVDDDVMLVDAAYDGLGGGAPAHAAITAIHDSTGADDGYLQFAGEPADVPGDGDYVVTGNYNNCQASQTARWAYLADASAELGVVPDDAHKRGR